MPHTSQIVGRWLLSVAFLAMFLGTVVLARLGVRSLLEDRRLSAESAHWPTTQGLVVSSSLDEGRRGSPGCRPRIRYRYVVDGRSYESRRVSFQVAWSCWHAELAARSHPAQHPVRVYYRPTDPAESVLEPNTWDNDGFLGFILVLMTLLILGALPLATLGLLGLVPVAWAKGLTLQGKRASLPFGLWLFPFLVLGKILLLPLAPFRRRE
jgi:hypothetical protein